jgi:hypothetical protein
MPALRQFLVVATMIVLTGTVAIAQTPQDEALMAWERSINNTRIDRLRALAPQMLPECHVPASDSDLESFFALWRIVAAGELVRMEKFDAAMAGRPSPIKYAPEVSLRTLQSVDASVPGAEDAARRQIETWHILHCVDAAFHGTKYFAAMGYDTIGPGHIPITFAHVAGTETAMRVPDMKAIEPIEALGKFFRAAQAKGLLTFDDEDEESYFFTRYETDYFAKWRESDMTRNWFQTPPWTSPPQ